MWFTLATQYHKRFVILSSDINNKETEEQLNAMFIWVFYVGALTFLIDSFFVKWRIFRRGISNVFIWWVLIARICKCNSYNFDPMNSKHFVYFRSTDAILCCYWLPDLCGVYGQPHGNNTKNTQQVNLHPIESETMKWIDWFKTNCIFAGSGLWPINDCHRIGSII